MVSGGPIKPTYLSKRRGQRYLWPRRHAEVGKPMWYSETQLEPKALPPYQWNHGILRTPKLPQTTKLQVCIARPYKTKGYWRDILKTEGMGDRYREINERLIRLVSGFRFVFQRVPVSGGNHWTNQSTWKPRDDCVLQYDVTKVGTTRPTTKQAYDWVRQTNGGCPWCTTYS